MEIRVSIKGRNVLTEYKQSNKQTIAIELSKRDTIKLAEELVKASVLVED